MIIPLSITEQLLFNTVRIEVETTEGRGTGTGFFFIFSLQEGQTALAIITNKHVVKDAVAGRLVFHTAVTDEGQRRPSEHSFSVQFAQFETCWIQHPDPNVDLCTMLLHPLQIVAQGLGHSIFTCPLGEEHIPSASQLTSFRAMEDVVMAGYPRGIWDDVNNLPLLRRGITATHPAVDFGGRSVTVVDLACFPGSSGSPVLHIDENVFQITDDGVTETKGGGDVALLGVLFAGPTMEATGEIIVHEIPTSAKPMAVTQVMMHLGHIVKAREILVLGEYIRKEVVVLEYYAIIFQALRVT